MGSADNVDDDFDNVPLAKLMEALKKKVVKRKNVDQDDIPLAQRFEKIRQDRRNHISKRKDQSVDKNQLKKIKQAKDNSRKSKDDDENTVRKNVKFGEPDEKAETQLMSESKILKKLEKPKKTETKEEKEKRQEKREHKEKGENEEKEENFDDTDQDFSWLENADDSIKWTSLEHQGPCFPPEYEPHGVKMLYDGVPVALEPEAEEVAGFYAALLNTEHATNPTFIKNFFEDFCTVLKECNSAYRDIVKDFAKCDFGLMHAHFERLKEEKRNTPKEQKVELKNAKMAVEEQYGYCLLDGRKEKVGNFRVEPPGLFRGRGKHPKTGMLKRRVRPEQVTINIGSNVPIPRPPPGHNWANVVRDQKVTWLATWIDNINRSQKYVFLAANSSLKAQSDFKKFETARKLAKVVDDIRQANTEELVSDDMVVRQRATALWLIDHLALRAGNEKGDDEADTVGCCSLRIEHIQLQSPNILVLDFLGKDSIRYYNAVPIDPLVYKNISIFTSLPKTLSDPVFDKLSTSLLNKYLNRLMAGLTAKVFRTFNASWTFQDQLVKRTEEQMTIPEKILAYNRSNREVAVLCNHQRAVPKTHSQSMERLNEKILTLKYQRYMAKKELKSLLSIAELKRDFPEALESDKDLDEETVRKKAAEEQEKMEQKDEPSPTPKKRTASAETLQKRITSLTLRIAASKSQLIDRDENKTTALSTSKLNYIDPRITAAWCQFHGVAMEKIFNKTLREKFRWAMSVNKDWRF